ncbi:MAG: alpha/beta fold hydrolase, partial [Cytophagales bacterium]|nr:alpha/beta fold hydrolase [Cytophagales bacterium]
MVAIGIFLALEALMYIGFDGIMLTPSDAKVMRAFDRDSIRAEVRHYQVDGQRVRYLDVGDTLLPLIIFIHGAPGALVDFGNLYQDSALLAHYRMVSVDRPGYGSSGFGRARTSIQEQARLLAPLLHLNRHAQKPILVGHSFGGPVVARMAMDYQSQIGEIHLVAGAVDPGHEVIFWISYPLSVKPLTYLMPVGMQVANREKLAHVEELQKMLPLWQNITVPVTIIHGEKDKLVPIQNAY